MSHRIGSDRFKRKSTSVGVLVSEPVFPALLILLFLLLVVKKKKREQPPPLRPAHAASLSTKLPEHTLQVRNHCPCGTHSPLIQSFLHASNRKESSGQKRRCTYLCEEGTHLSGWQNTSNRCCCQMPNACPQLSRRAAQCTTLLLSPRKLSSHMTL